jgi:hypothetical protein
MLVVYHINGDIIVVDNEDSNTCREIEEEFEGVVENYHRHIYDSGSIIITPDTKIKEY